MPCISNMDPMLWWASFWVLKQRDSACNILLLTSLLGVKILFFSAKLWLKNKIAQKNSSKSAFFSITDPRNKVGKEVFFHFFLGCHIAVKNVLVPRICVLIRKTGIGVSF